MKPILSLDFDGVLNSYASGWQGAACIPDLPVEGAIDFVRQALRHFRVCICSSRCVSDDADRQERNDRGIAAMQAWFARHGLTTAELSQLEFWHTKPPAHVMIDDRAHRFDGTFPSIEDLKSFKPWNKR